jgi:hypothetical protein
VNHDKIVIMVVVIIFMLAPGSAGHHPLPLYMVADVALSLTGNDR